MQAVVAEAMAAGRQGFATSASPTHNGDGGRPGAVAGGRPRRAAGPARPRCTTPGKGVVALLPGDVISHRQVSDIQREVGRPVTWTALLTVKGYPYHEKVVAENDAARARRGRGLAPGVVPTPGVPDEPGRALHLEQPAELLPAHGPDLEDRMAAYRDPAWRASTWEELSGGDGRTSAFNWPSVSVAESASRPELVGRGVVDVAAERGCTPLDVMLDVSLDDDLKTRFWSVLANDDPDAIAWLLPRDNVLLGLADSGAHVSQLCDACFATDLLGTWVRDRGVMPLERAVHKLTGEPAGVYGLGDRGTVEVGKAADLCVFDPDDGGARPAAPGPRLPGRRGTADGRRPGGDDPRPRERGAHPGRQRTRSRGARLPARDAPAQLSGLRRLLGGLPRLVS